MHGKLTEGPVIAGKVHGVSQLHGKLTKVDGSSIGRTKRFRKVPRMHEILTEGPEDAQRVNES